MNHILDLTTSFWLWPNHYGQVQINLVRPKSFWTDQNCFGHTEGQCIIHMHLIGSSKQKRAGLGVVGIFSIITLFVFNFSIRRVQESLAERLHSSSFVLLPFCMKLAYRKPSVANILMSWECYLNPIYKWTYFLWSVYFGLFYFAEVERETNHPRNSN